MAEGIGLDGRDLSEEYDEVLASLGLEGLEPGRLLNVANRVLAFRAVHEVTFAFTYPVG